MGRPVESPWEVRWTPEASYRHLALFHGDRRVLHCLPPDTMLSVVETAGLATSDLRHLLLWAAWLVAALFKARNSEREEVSMRKARIARSILRPAPGQDFDFPNFWNGLRYTHPVVPYAAVAHLPTPPPEDLINGFMASTECVRDLMGFLASR